ncbi:MAG: hypothetical protein MUF71_15760 [Candidatus Kapabacteria bacterium]|nr:hypothetical protein [Candidatus Kapabacteria bacterium]
MIPIDGITEYDAFGSMKKYFIEIPEICLGNEAVIEAKKQEVITQYERDKQEAERERARKEAQYLQDLEIINEKNSNSHNDNKTDTIQKVEFVTSEQLQRFWDAKTTERMKVVKSIFTELGYSELNLRTIPMDYARATHYDYLIKWLIELYLPFKPDENSWKDIDDIRDEADRILSHLQHHLLSITDTNQQATFLMHFWIILQNGDDYTRVKNESAIRYIGYVITSYIGRLSTRKGIYDSRFSLEDLQVNQGIATFAQFMDEVFEDSAPPDNLILQWTGTESLIYRLAYGFLYSNEMEQHRVCMRHGDNALFIKRFVKFFGIQTDNSDPANKIQNLPKSPFKALEEGLENYEDSKSKGKTMKEKGSKSSK